MSGRTKASSMRWAASLGLAGQPRGCAYSASLGSIANFGLRAQIGWSAKCRSGGGVEALGGAIPGAAVFLRGRDRRDFLVNSMFFVDFHPPSPRVGAPG